MWRSQESFSSFLEFFYTQQVHARGAWCPRGFRGFLLRLFNLCINIFEILIADKNFHQCLFVMFAYLLFIAKFFRDKSLLLWITLSSVSYLVKFKLILNHACIWYRSNPYMITCGKHAWSHVNIYGRSWLHVIFKLIYDHIWWSYMASMNTYDNKWPCVMFKLTCRYK